MPGARLKFFYRVGAPSVPRTSGPATSRVELDRREVRAFTELAGVNYDRLEDRMALGQAVCLIRAMGGSADLYIDPESLPDPDQRSLVALLLAAVDSDLILGHDGKRALHREPTDQCRSVARVCSTLSSTFPGALAFDGAQSASVLKKSLRLTGREAAMIMNRTRRIAKAAEVAPSTIDSRARNARRAAFPLFPTGGGGISGAPVSNQDFSDPVNLGLALAFIPIVGGDGLFSWQPQDTAERDLLCACYQAADGSATFGEPVEMTSAADLEEVRALIPFAANVIALQYLNTVAPTNDLTAASRLAHELHAAGASLRLISDELTYRGYATKRGSGRWSASAVRALEYAEPNTDSTEE